MGDVLTDISVRSPAPEVGDSSLAVLQYIAQLHGLDEVTVFRHSVGINWRQQVPDSEKADRLDDPGFFAHNRDQALETLRLGSAALGRLTVAALVERSGPHEVFSANSLVCHEGSEQHIPMMNFHPEEGDLDFVMRSLHRFHTMEPQLFPPGAVVTSGRYYHYYGYQLISPENWHRFLSYFLMPSILVSPRYIGHALYEGQSSLRLTFDDAYKPHLPVVCAKLTHPAGDFR